LEKIIASGLGGFRLSPRPNLEKLLQPTSAGGFRVSIEVAARG
jgi:hypothetical protein